MAEAEDLDTYIRSLTNRNSGQLNVGAAYSDVQNRYKDELDWRNQRDMREYLESRGVDDSARWRCYIRETTGGKLMPNPKSAKRPSQADVMYRKMRVKALKKK